MHRDRIITAVPRVTPAVAMRTAGRETFFCLRSSCRILRAMNGVRFMGLRALGAGLRVCCLEEKGLFVLFLWLFRGL